MLGNNSGEHISWHTDTLLQCHRLDTFVKHADKITQALEQYEKTAQAMNDKRNAWRHTAITAKHTLTMQYIFGKTEND